MLTDAVKCAEVKTNPPMSGVVDIYHLFLYFEMKKVCLMGLQFLNFKGICTLSRILRAMSILLNIDAIRLICYST